MLIGSRRADQVALRARGRPNLPNSGCCLLPYLTVVYAAESDSDHHLALSSA
jgi:hypothetical protein